MATLARQTEGLSGADVAKICDCAVEVALEEASASSSVVINFPATDPAAPWNNEQDGNTALQNKFIFPTVDEMLLAIIDNIDLMQTADQSIVAISGRVLATVVSASNCRPVFDVVQPLFWRSSGGPSPTRRRFSANFVARCKMHFNTVLMNDCKMYLMFRWRRDFAGGKRSGLFYYQF